MRVLRLLFANLGHFRAAFIAIFIVGMIDGAVVFFVPVLLAEYTKTSFTSVQIWQLMPLLIVCYFASHGLQWILRKFGEALGPRYALHLRLKYFDELESLPMERLAQHHSGYLLSLVSTVSGGMGNLTIEMFWGVSRCIINLSLFFYFTARESVVIALANLIILVSFIALSGRFSRRMVPLATELNLQGAALAGTYADFAANLMTVKKLGIQRFAADRLRAVSDENVKHLRAFQDFHAMRWFTLHSLFSLAMIFTITFLLYEISQGRVSASILILFVAAFTAVRMNAERISEDFKTILELDAYVTSLVDVLKDSRRPAQAPPIREWSSITLKELSFHHRGSSVFIQVPHLEIRKGERIGIIGSSGQGKTTLLHLIADFYQPLAGARYVDSTEYTSLPATFFNERFSLVSQEVELLNLSVRENLLLGKPMADEELLVLLDEIGLRSWIDSVSGGLSSIIGEKGVTVSQGQKQRLSLIRAYLFSRDIYLLDEPTSHLDPENQDRLMQFIHTRLGSKTLIIVSHSERILELCSTVYEMRDNTLFKLEAKG